jgi:hypothetical protein
MPAHAISLVRHWTPAALLNTEYREKRLRRLL